MRDKANVSAELNESLASDDKHASVEQPLFNGEGERLELIPSCRLTRRLARMFRIQDAIPANPSPSLSENRSASPTLTGMVRVVASRRLEKKALNVLQRQDSQSRSRSWAHLLQLHQFSKLSLVSLFCTCPSTSMTQESSPCLLS